MPSLAVVDRNSKLSASLLYMRVSMSSHAFVARNNKQRVRQELDQQRHVKSLCKPSLGVRRGKIVDGRVAKIAKERALLEQPFIKDTSKTVAEHIKAAVAAIGENIQVRHSGTGAALPYYGGSLRPEVCTCVLANQRLGVGVSWSETGMR